MGYRLRLARLFASNVRQPATSRRRKCRWTLLKAPLLLAFSRLIRMIPSNYQGLGAMSWLHQTNDSILLLGDAWGANRLLWVTHFEPTPFREGTWSILIQTQLSLGSRHAGVAQQPEPQPGVVRFHLGCCHWRKPFLFGSGKGYQEENN